LSKKPEGSQSVNRRLNALREAQQTFNEGFQHHQAGRFNAAAARYKAALELNADHADAHNNLGNILKHQGSFDDAMAHYDKAIAIRPAYAEAHLNRSEIKTFTSGDADLAALEALTARTDLSDEKALLVEFALGKALEDTGDFDRAFEHLREGNARKRRLVVYNEEPSFHLIRRVAKVFDRSLLDRLQGAGDPSQVPVFVLGMPRSGSTLVEQILASHPQIHGAGELTDFAMAATSVLNAARPGVPFPECVPNLDRAVLQRIGEAYLARLPVPPDGKTRIVDKLPSNFLAIGLIRLALPNARIIHTVRDPVDTCVSCYSKLFANGHPFTYDLGELGRHFRHYRGLMDHWQTVVTPGAILDVSYEAIVDDLEGEARRLIEYCGLPWDDRCINFHSTSRQVRTASSVQVRKPLFRSSLQRWRRYEAGIAPLLSELGAIVSK
jgi:tetratricopeptide (TPR) repeat protein